MHKNDCKTTIFIFDKSKHLVKVNILPMFIKIIQYENNEK